MAERVASSLIDFVQSINIYHSADEAALDFVKKAVPLTLDDDRERGAFIYELQIAGLGEWHFYPYIFEGAHNNVILGFTAGYLTLPKVETLGVSLKPSSFAHTHPDCVCHIGDAFSAPDKALTFLPGIKYVYLGTPNGKNLRIDKRNLSPKEVNTDPPRIPTYMINFSI